MTSEAEGFGLSIIEALACGAVVIASDISVIRVVGGDVLIYSPTAAIEQWSDSVFRALTELFSHLPGTSDSLLSRVILNVSHPRDW